MHVYKKCKRPEAASQQGSECTDRQHSWLRLQDRHLLIEDFKPSEEADLKERCPEVRSLVGVFDGHKRSEPAETAARRLPELLSRSGPVLAGIGRAR